ncbi:NADPH2 dehydrogenase [Pseudohyphozyma bogoriensis]|nr:NADPH2 dehydrogenase [Pseudohyphozyma bogoriensis]
MQSALFTPLQLGDIHVEHRIAMAPLTRIKADDDHVHTDLARQYYEQRAQFPGTLIITEATYIAPEAGGEANVPGIYNDKQIAAWKRIVDAVHSKGSSIVLQLWARGRTAIPEVLANEPEGPFDVVSASDVPFEGGATPRPLTEAEIQKFVGFYAQAAKNFVEKAGGDGVEIHSANGYLIDQFLQTTSNRRTDGYGGSVENRARFGLEVLKAVTDAVGEKKVGIRISPFSAWQGMKMAPADIEETFGYYVSEIKKRFPHLAYLHAVEGRVHGIADATEEVAESLDFIVAKAVAIAEKRQNTVTVFGRYFIANPDLVYRIKNGLEFNKYKRELFYIRGTDPHGYIDYPNYNELKAIA